MGFFFSLSIYQLFILVYNISTYYITWKSRLVMGYSIADTFKTMVKESSAVDLRIVNLLDISDNLFLKLDQRTYCNIDRKIKITKET